MEVSMKVLMINGSPHEKGCTYTALREVATSLEKQGVESEILWIGKGSIHGCSACGSCKTTGVCIFTKDLVNEAAAKAKAYRCPCIGVSCLLCLGQWDDECIL